MSDVWYYADRNGKVGPFRLSELKETLRTFQNASDVLVWRAGFPDWKPARGVVELSEVAPMPPPLPSETRRVQSGGASERNEKKVLGSPQDRQKQINRSFGLFIGLPVAAFLLIGLLSQQSKETPSSTASALSAVDRVRSAPPTEVLSFTAQEIFSAYEANEVATDNSLKGHIIEIRGTVQSVDKDVWGRMHVRLRTSNQFMSANMQVDAQEESKVANLRQGQSVVVRCPKMIRWAGSPTGNDCLLKTY